ncbi:MAG: M56 family metallopeptidase, partial [Myxococcota bacterium]
MIIVSSVASSGLVALALTTVRGPHRVNHQVSRAAIFAFIVVLVGFTVVINDAATPRLIPNDPASERTMVASVLHQITVATTPGLHSKDGQLSLWLWLGALWLVGAFFGLIPLIRTARALQQIQRSAETIDARAVVTQPRSLLHHLDRSRVRVALSNDVDQPCTFGFGPATLLLPKDIIHHLSTDELAAIIAHELAHIERHDFIKNLMIQIFRSLLWFDPFFWLMTHRYEQSREMACDLRALRAGLSAQSLAS